VFPIHQCSGFVLAQQGGQKTVTLNTNQMPAHTYTPRASSAGGSDNPAGNYWGNSTTRKPYSKVPLAVQMNAGTITTVGGSQLNNNMMPYLTLNFCIAMRGGFPPTT
jgi:microcystin-dependent protein